MQNMKPNAIDASNGVKQSDTTILETIIDKANKELIPLTVLLELTRKCNLKCRHCYLIKDNSGDEMSKAMIFSLIDELRLAGCLFITFTGGEPLLRPDFLDICRQASSSNMAINIFTNGTLITEELARELSALNILDVSLSIYGATDETHDNITRKKGAYHQTLQGALILKKHGLNVRFKYIMMNANIADYEQMLNLSIELNIPYDLDPVITPRDNGDRAPTKFRLNNKALKKIYSSLNISPRSAPDTRYRDGWSCSFGRSHCAISACGDVYPCIQLPVSSGNLSRQSFGMIWNHSDWLKEVRKFSSDKITACRKCSLSDYCRQCPGLAYVEEGSLYSPSQEACRHAKVLSLIPLTGSRSSSS